MIQINPLKSYIDGGVRAALTTPPSASLVFDLPGKAIWVKGVKLKGTDHTYTFSHDNYITLTNTPDSNESEDIKIGVNTSALKNAIDTTYGVVSTTVNGLAPKFTSENKQAAAAATTYYFLGWTGSTLKWYQAPFRNIRINSETTDCLGVNNTDPLIISSGNGISVTWDSTNKKIIITNTKPDINHNTDTKVAQSVTTQNKNYAVILKGNDSDEGSITTVNFSTYLKFNPYTKQLISDGEYYANGNQRLAHISEIPTSLKNPYALTISLNGTSQGSYDGSASKNINITPSSIGAATSGHNHDGRYVYNYGGAQMDGASINKNALGMSTTSGISGDWWHILQAAWNDEYRWNSQIAFPTQNRNGVYYRSGLDDNTAWGAWVKLLDVNNYASILDSRYYTESESDGRFVNVTGDTMTGPLQLNGSPSQGNPPLQINYTSNFEPSDQTIGLLKFGKLTTHDMYLGISPTTRTHFGRVGYFMHVSSNCEFTWASSGWTNLMALTGGTGNLWVKGSVTTGSFIKSGSSNSYVLLGGGGHKLISDFATSSHAHSSITIPVCSSLNGNSDVFSVEYAGDSNSVATKPSGVDAFGVMRLRTAAGWYGQIMMSANTAPGIYYRNANGLSSSVGWKKLLDSGNFGDYAAAKSHTHAISQITNLQATLDGKAAASHTHSYLPLSGGTLTGDLYINTNLYGPAAGNNPRNRYDSELHFFNSNSSTTSTYNFGLYQWNDEFHFTYRTSADDLWKGNAFIIQGSDGQVAFVKTPKVGSTLVSLAGHTHSYLPLSGGTMTGNINIGNSDIIGYGGARILQNLSGNLGINPSNNVGIGTTSPSYKLHVTGDIYTTTGFVKSGSSDSYVLLGGGGHKAVSDFATSGHTHPYLYTEQVTQEQNSDAYTWIRSYVMANKRGHVYNTHALEWQYLYGISSGGTYGNIIRSTYGDGVPAMQIMGLYNGNWSSWVNVLTEKNYNSYAPTLTGTGASGTWGISVSGNAASATKLTSSAGSATLPIYFSDGKPVACTAASVFSNLTNSGNNISITVAGQNRTLTVGYASNADTVDGWNLNEFHKSAYVTSYTGGLSSYWGKLWDITITTWQYNDMDMTLLLHSAYDSKYSIVNVRLRQNGANSSGAYNFSATLHILTGNIPTSDMRLYYNNSTGACSLWVNCGGQWGVVNCKVLSYTMRTETESKPAGTFYTTVFSSAQTLPSSSYVNGSNIGNVAYASSAGNSDTCDGLHVHGGRNNEANKIVRTDGSGFIQCGYINSSNGDEGNNSSPARVWGTNGSDSYMRTYLTSALSVKYAASAGNADTVDGYHATGLWRSDGATWNPGANVSLNASANNQEWSFDIRRNGYTGCYWHVWDSSLNTMLKVNADNGKVYAPYNFVGNLEGNASSATTATYLNVQYCRDDGQPSNKGLWNTIKNGTTNAITNRVRFYTIYGTTTALGAPIDGFGELLEICSYNINHWQPQLWFGSGKDGRLYYRNKSYNNNTWGSWRTVAWTSEIPTVTNYYWANVKISASSSTSTSPTFSTCYSNNWFRSTGTTGWYNETYSGGWYMNDTTWIRTWNSKGIYTNTGAIYNLGHAYFACNSGYNVGIGTSAPSYKLHVTGDSYTTGWSRAASGFYCESTGVHFTHHSSYTAAGEIDMTSTNEFCWGSSNASLYFNYRKVSRGTTVTNYIWNAGSSSSYASHTTGNITLGNGGYQIKRVGQSASWIKGRDSAIVRQTTANAYSAIISSKTTNGSWEIGNYTNYGNNLCFTYITDSNYNSGNNTFSGQVYFDSGSSVYATHFYEKSDIRYKKILRNLSINSNTIANLPLFDFEWIENNVIGTGTSAQAVQKILPNIVSGTDKLTLDYGVLGTIAGITACKELVKVNIEIFNQKSELQQLKNKVKQLEDKLRKYENA